jgi:putative ABC transport system permease protein
MDRGWSARLVPFSHEFVGDGIRKALYVLLGAVGLLVLIACASLSNLLLVRASARAHELAIRTALGASRAQIIRQIVTESLVVTLAGGLLGTLVSLWSVQLMHSLPLPRASEISIDLLVLGLALAMTLLVGVFSGLGQALNASQAKPQNVLKSAGPRAGHRSRLRDTMVVAQLAISLTLLVGVTLLGRSLIRLLHVNPGFNTKGVLTVSLRPGDKEHAVAFYERLTERVATLPGVSGVGLTSSLPLSDDGNTSNNIFPVGPSVMPAGESIQSSWRLVDGGYFNALQIPLLRGRSFAGLSPDEARKSVVLSASLARQLFGDTYPIGRQIDNLKIGGLRLTVIGVAGDVRSQKVGTAPTPTFYWSMHLFLYGPMNLVVHTQPDVANLLPALRQTIEEIDPSVPVFRVHTLEQLRATNLGQERLIFSLLGGFTGIAVLLAALGTYGVVSFTVLQRTREIGIRVAIGAQISDVLRLVLGQGIRLVMPGMVLGLAIAFVSTRVLSRLLYETGTTDAISYMLAVLALGLAAALACWFPARRATKVNPIEALRAE